MKYVLLIRHAESTKNIENRFSQPLDEAPITSSASQLTHYLSEEIVLFSQAVELPVTKIFCAQSARAEETANLISRRLQAPLVQWEGLDSMVVAASKGESVEQFQIDNVDVAYELNLSRSGLLNNYQMRDLRGALIEFEQGVFKSFIANVSNLDCGLAVGVAHRSALNAILVNCARSQGIYPERHYGYLNLELLGCSLVIVDDSGKMRIAFVDLSTDSLCVAGVSLFRYARARV